MLPSSHYFTIIDNPKKLLQAVISFLRLTIKKKPDCLHNLVSSIRDVKIMLRQLALFTIIDNPKKLLQVFAIFFNGFSIIPLFP